MQNDSSVKKSISAMYGWAIELQKSIAKNKNSNRENRNKFISSSSDLLRKIDRQGRKLEYRGRGRGLKGLPETDNIEELKEKITMARAAAKTSAKEIKKANIPFKKLEENVASLVESLKIANELAKEMLTLDPVELVKEENKGLMVDFLNCSGPYEKRAYDKSYFKIRDQIFLMKKDFSTLNLNNTNFKKARLIGLNFTNAVLSKRTFDRCNIKDTDFSGANLFESLFTKTKIKKTKFNHANITRMVLYDFKINQCEFVGAISRGKEDFLQQVNSGITHSAVRRTRFGDRKGYIRAHKSTIKNTTFLTAQLPLVIFAEVNMKNVKFDYSNLEKSYWPAKEEYLIKCRWKNVSFIKANLKSSHIEGPVFDNVNFTQADAKKSVMMLINFKEVDFTQTNLEGATLSGNFKTVNFTKANLKGSDLRGKGNIPAEFKKY